MKKGAKLSVKAKITLWLTLLTACLAGLLLLLLLSLSSAVDRQSSIDLLRRVAEDNARSAALSDGQLVLGADFLFLEEGVSSLVYSREKALLAGQLPVSLTSLDAPFVSGEVRTIALENSDCYILDIYLPASWEEGVWLRSLLEAPRHRLATLYMLRTAFFLLPFFVLLAGLGAYWILRRAFRPLDRINATARAIHEARDLSGRIGLPPGNDEFTRLGENFDSMFARLESSFEAEKRFAADASHELRTPLSVIRGACEYAEKYNECEEDYRESIAMIRRQTERMQGLVTQLLQMTRLEQGTEALRLARTELAPLLESICAEGAYDPSRLHPDLEAGLWAEADPALLGRLVTNLLDNAFKFSPPEGRIWLRLYREADEIRLSVADEGPGIPAEARERVFQRFYQLDPARSGEIPGAGLGLAMAAQIAALHGGRMELGERAGGGCVFTLYLPAASA